MTLQSAAGTSTCPVLRPSSSIAIRLPIGSALKHVWEPGFGQVLGRVPDSSPVVLVRRPSQTLFIFPCCLQRRVFAVAHQVASFMKKHSGPLSIVDGKGEEFWIERHYFKRKIRRRISVVVANIRVPPVVCTPERSQVIEDECFAGEARLLKHGDRFIYSLALIGLKSG